MTSTLTHRAFLSLGLSALVFGGVTVGCAGGGARIAAANRPVAVDARQVAQAIDRHSPEAVALAEAAVAAAPTRADLRVLLGRSYIQAGRFQSARAAFADSLRLQPGDGRAALNLALAQIATGDWRGARATLDTDAANISASDRGLAIALAGDPATGVAILMQAARQAKADPKVRQNLGLALALAGQWQMARTVAATDMSPVEVDRRMQEWAAFTQPAAASDQIAALLGVQVQVDAGQPVALALNAPVPVAPATETEAPVMALAAAVPTTTPVAATPAADAAPAGVVRQAVPPATILSAARISFAPRREVVQPLPVPLLRADGPTKLAFAAARREVAASPGAARQPAAGDWFVQLGAFENAGVARDAWGRISRRHAGLVTGQPQGVAFRSAGNDFYRLSVGGYDRAGADGLCRRVRAQGGVCFVRRGAGDRMAQWVRGGVQFASR